MAKAWPLFELGSVNHGFSTVLHLDMHENVRVNIYWIGILLGKKTSTERRWRYVNLKVEGVSFSRGGIVDDMDGPL